MLVSAHPSIQSAMLLLALVPDKVFGLPAHPLLVHAAVVMVPLAAVALIATGWREAWRRIYLLPIALLAIGGAGFAFLAKESGEPLQKSVRAAGKRVGEHPEQGDTAFVFAGLFAAICLAFYLYQTFGDRVRERVGWTERYRTPVDEGILLYAISIPLAALAIWTMMVAGHSGAKLVWDSAK
jgi:hypothetical protein